VDSDYLFADILQRFIFCVVAIFVLWQSKLLLGELGEMLKDRHVTDNGSIHKVCANAVNRPVTVEFLHGGIAHGRGSQSYSTKV
jgi:hypothetical protein